MAGSFKNAVMLFVAATALSGPVFAQQAAKEKELPKLKGYSPPSMFSAPPSALAPSPAPGNSPEPRAESAAPIASPPVQAPLVTPAPVAPAPAPLPQPVQTPAPLPVPQKVQPQPVIRQPAPVPSPTPVPLPLPSPPPIVKPAAQTGLTAEDLLNHPTTSDDPGVSTPLLNPMAAPAAPVEMPLALPGSLPDDLPVPTGTRKTPVKKVVETTKPESESSVPELKKLGKKSVGKPVPIPKRKPTMPVQIKGEPQVDEQADKSAKPQEEVKKEAPQKQEPIKPATTVDKKADLKTAVPPAPVKPAAKPDAKIEEKAEAKPEAKQAVNPAEKSDDYRLKGKKNMPVAAPKPVDSEPLDVLPLPKLQNKQEQPLSANEKMIDNALAQRLVEPDANKIAAKLPDANDKKAPDSATKKPPASEKPVPASELLSLEFKPKVTEVQADQKELLKSSILPLLDKSKTARLQILAYASTETGKATENSGSARRVSLARGLSIRAALLEMGIMPTRMDVRALGDQTNEKPADRVDLVMRDEK